MRRGNLIVSLELIRQLLKIPKDVEVFAVKENDEYAKIKGQRTVIFALSGGTLPEVAELADSPIVLAIYKNKGGVVEFDSWEKVEENNANR